MEQDNLDTRLQEIERQSLPDLSRLDQHWAEMQGLIGTTSPTPGKYGDNKGLWRYVFTGIILGASILLIYTFSAKENTPAVSKKRTETVVQKPSFADTGVHPATTSIKDSILSPHKNTLVQTHPLAATKKAIQYQPVQTHQTRISNTNRQMPEENKDAVTTFFNQVKKQAQQFVIDNNHDTVLTGREGTTLTIKAGSFRSKDKIVIGLKEFYQYSDMVLNQLTTTSDNQQLVTGGMIHISAHTDGLPVTLEKKQPLIAAFPQKGNTAKMELFYGESSTADTVIKPTALNWKRAGVNPISNLSAKPVRTMSVKKENRMRVKGDSSIGILSPQFDSMPGGRFDIINSYGSGTNQFLLNRLGWINCDRFLNDQRKKILLITVLPAEAVNFHTVLVFEKMRSILPASRLSGKEVQFIGLPEGETVQLISIGNSSEKGLLMMAMQAIRITTDMRVTPDFKSYTPEEIRAKLQLLNSISPNQ